MDRPNGPVWLVIASYERSWIPKDDTIDLPAMFDVLAVRESMCGAHAHFLTRDDTFERSMSSLECGQCISAQRDRAHQWCEQLVDHPASSTFGHSLAQAQLASCSTSLSDLAEAVTSSNAASRFQVLSHREKLASAAASAQSALRAQGPPVMDEQSPFRQDVINGKVTLAPDHNPTAASGIYIVGQHSSAARRVITRCAEKRRLNARACTAHTAALEDACVTAGGPYHRRGLRYWLRNHQTTGCALPALMCSVHAKGHTFAGTVGRPATIADCNDDIHSRQILHAFLLPLGERSAPRGKRCGAAQGCTARQW